MALRQVEKHTFDGSKTSGGYYNGSFNWHGTLRQVLIRSFSPDTTYNIAIVDEDGYVVYNKYDLKGIFASDELGVIIFPGEKRFVIDGASSDEFFNIKLVYQL